MSQPTPLFSTPRSSTTEPALFTVTLDMPACAFFTLASVLVSVIAGYGSWAVWIVLPYTWLTVVGGIVEWMYVRKVQVPGLTLRVIPSAEQLTWAGNPYFTHDRIPLWVGLFASAMVVDMPSLSAAAGAYLYPVVRLHVLLLVLNLAHDIYDRICPPRARAVPVEVPETTSSTPTLEEESGLVDSSSHEAQ